MQLFGENPGRKCEHKAGRRRSKGGTGRHGCHEREKQRGLLAGFPP